ncbi:methyl-accepting chemotaxis protein [Stenotrophomonas sp.]|uniref:methyl-accepting chemotaxis protein n=1 Tax=Stenotrophomonas sp. TaxID=69392 RepID=UPI0028A9D618|nr:methyl-accepting chemotaxis protein [Stenotrophomonas sp.]
MQNFLLRFRVNQRLTIAFGILIAITLAIAATGIWSLSATGKRLDQIVTQSMVKIRLSTQMLDANAQVVAAIQGLLLEEQPEQRQQYADAVVRTRATYDTSRNALFAMPASEADMAIRRQITATRDTARPLNQAVIDLAMAGDRAQAMARFDEASAATQAWQDNIRRNIAQQEANAQAAYQEATASTVAAHRLLVSGAVAAALLSLLLAFCITRSLVLPLRASTAMAHRIAEGDVGGRVSIVGRDETADLLRAMDSMQTRIAAVIASQRTLAAEQEQGSMSFRLDDREHPGAFGDVIRASNAMAEQTAAVIGQILATASRYSVGDLDARMPALPGEQAAITAAMETTRSNLLAVSVAINTLAEAAAQGDFSERGDAAAFDHTFRQIIDRLNQLFDICDSSLADMARILTAIADGDLTVQARADQRGVFAQMGNAANTTAQNLQRIIRGIQSGTEVIHTSSSEIANGTSDLAKRTEQQAASLEETAASMEELTSTVRQNAEHARQANALADAAERSASEGGTVVAQVVDTMGRIEQSSNRVAEIISAIDGIAFQTNILALNAAVEAARAGEQGRGFAVVASEVRTLAQRSAAAAKDVKTLVEGSAAEVRTGAGLVQQAGAAMSGIVGSIRQVRHAVAEISAASQEQSAGIEQVNQAVVHMDEATQQNAALVEEASAASRSMQDQAESLQAAVAVFRV